MTFDGFFVAGPVFFRTSLQYLDLVRAQMALCLLQTQYSLRLLSMIQQGQRTTRRRHPKRTRAARSLRGRSASQRARRQGRQGVHR